MPESRRTLVAVAQIACHPAIALPGRSPLSDPLFDMAGQDTLRPEGDPPKGLRDRFDRLRERIEGVYCRQLLAKLTAILRQCQDWGVRLLVLPEYSVPWQILEDLARAGGDLVVVAGTHSVTQASIKSGVYDRLGGPRPRIGEAVCPVLHRGHLLGLQPKLSPAKLEADWLKPGQTWQPIALPDGLPSPMGVLVCLDFLYRESGAHRDLVAAGLKDCRFLAVPSYTPQYTIAELNRKADEDAGRYRRPVLWSDVSTFSRKMEAGGSTIFVDQGHAGDLRRFPQHPGFLEPGDEGVVVAEVDLGYERRGESTQYAYEPPVVPFALASLVYRARPGGEAYAAWLAETEKLLARGDDEALMELAERVRSSETTLRDAAPGEQARARRIDELIHSAPGLTSLDQFRRFLRDVVLPPEVLPVDALRSALAAGASEALFDWQRDHRGHGLAKVVETLHKASPQAQSPDQDAWCAAALAMVSSLRQEVAELQPPAPTGDASPAARQAVAPEGLDPALIGEVRSEKLVYRFRPHPEDFHDHEVEPETAANARELFLLAVAEESQGRTSAVAIGTEGAPAKAVLPITSLGGNRWILRMPEGFALDQIARNGLEAVGIRPEITSTSSADLKRRTAALLERFNNGLRRGAKGSRDRRLESVKQGFVEPFLRIGDQEMTALKALDHWLESKERTALLLGEYGSGKSTILATWCVRLWERDARPKPILCSLAGEASDDVIGLLLKSAGAEDTPGNRAAMMLLVEAGELLPCFDGFDEMAPRHGGEEIPRRLASLLKVAGRTGRVLISSTENYFEGEETGLIRMTLRPFTTGQISELMRKILGSEQKVQHALQRISSAYDLMDLVSRPLLLGLVLQSLDRINSSARIAPADIYDAYLNHWLAHAPENAASLSSRQKCVFAEAMAEALWRSGQPFCTWEDLRRTARDRVEPILPASAPSDVALRDVLGGAFFVREGSRFQFAHKSFLEFFLARSLLMTLERQPRQALDTRALTPEVAGFLGELLKRKGNPRDAESVRSVQSFLRTGREIGNHSSDDVAAANAFRLLLGLARWARDGAQWVPEDADVRGVPLAGETLHEAGLQSVESSYDLPRNESLFVAEPMEAYGAASPAVAIPPPAPKAAAPLDLKARLSRASDSRPPSNPFEPGLPLSAEPLPGREPLVHELISLVEKSYPVALIGPRRVGKTSLLASVSRRVPGDHPVKKLTLEGKTIRSADDLALLLEPDLGRSGDPSRRLLESLQKKPGRVYLLDEMAWLEEADRTVFPWLRSIGQDRLATLVLAGDRWDWTRVVKRAIEVSPGSSFGNDVTVLDLGPISEEEARRFLVETSRSVIREDTARRVVDLCGSWPFYLQVMGHALYVAADARQRAPFTQRDALLDLYHQRLLVDRAAVFQSRFGQLPREVQDLLRSNPLSRPELRSLSRTLRGLLVATGLCSILGEWLSDRPFFDWIRLEATTLG